MNIKSFLGILLIIFIFSLVFLSCSPEGTSKVTITIDLGLHNKAALNTYENSIIDRVFRFFAKDAEAAPPSHIDSVTLNVTGDGMDTITKTYLPPPASDTITLEVPAGNTRTFELLADTGSATLRGVATRNLEGGSTVTIPIQMGLYETKIVIPDAYYNDGTNNGRIVQIDSLATGHLIMIQLYSSNIAYSYSFRPIDIDFDRQGKIYIANNTNGSAGEYIVLAIDDINSSTFTPVVNAFGAAAMTITIDRVNNFLYYATSSQLNRYDLSTTTTKNYSMVDIQTIRGISTDNNGIIYIAGNYYGGANSIMMYDTNANSGNGAVIAQFTTNISNAWDTIFKDNSVFIANHTGSDGYKIVQLNTDLTASLANFGNNGTTTDPSSFYGPLRFLAVLNDPRFIMIDDNQWNNYDKLVSFNNMTGAGWETFGNSTVYGGGSFDFYYFC